MAVADRRFFGRAWASLASTRNVFGKLCLIALLQFVPVLGQMVTLGYFLGWVREAAWGMETPMPAHVLSGGDASFWPRAAKAWVVSLLYGLVGGTFYAVLCAVWVLFGHMQPGIVDDVVLGVLVALGLFGGIWLLIFYYVGLVRLAIYNRFGAAWQWGACLRMAGRDFGGLVKLFFGTLGLNLLISLFVGIIGALMGLIFMASALVTPSLTGLAGLFSADLDTLVAALISLTGAFIVGLPLLALLSFFLNIPFLVISAVCWRALGNWATQFDVPRWGAMSDPLPEPRAVEAALPVCPVAPTPVVTPSVASAPTQPVDPSVASSAVTSSASEVVPSSSQTTGSDADGLHVEMPAPLPAAGDAEDATTPQPAETDTPASASAGSSTPAMGTPTPTASVCQPQGYVCPQKRSHPVGVIVLCLLGSLVLSVIIGVTTACSSAGMVNVLDSYVSGTSHYVTASTSPEGYWTSTDGQSLSLNLSDPGSPDGGTFTWFYDASQSSYAAGTYYMNDVSDLPPSEYAADLIGYLDPTAGELADTLFELGLTPASMGVGVYELQMTAQSGVLNGQDATSSVEGNVVNALFLVSGNNGMLVDMDAVAGEDADSDAASSAVLFVTR